MNTDQEERNLLNEVEEAPQPVVENQQSNQGVNGFDFDKLRLSQDFSALASVKKALITVPVRKPNRQEFIRVHEEWSLPTAVLENKEDRETYLVEPDIWPELTGEIAPKILYPTMNRQGVLTIWPIRLPGEDGRHDEWSRSSLEAAEMAKKNWVRVAANMSLGAYEVYEAIAELPGPQWPDMTFEEILRIAFKDRFIKTFDHPALRRLRGEI